MSGQPPHEADAAQINLLHHQKLLQSQHQFQQQLLNSMPQQQFQTPHQFQQGNIPTYVYGMCVRRLTDYIHHQHHRPQDNNVDFWRAFAAEFFTPDAKKKLCFSKCESARQATWVYTWNCEICDHKLGHGFEAGFEVLPVLFKAKYESGILKEHLYVDLPHEYQNPSGQIVLYYSTARKETVFENFRVVHDGGFRVVFAPSLKICSLEFCVRGHEVFMSRKSLVPRYNQFVAAAEKYRALARSEVANVSAEEVQNSSNMLVASTHNLAKGLDAHLVYELGYPKSYVRRLQISQVANSMKDLIGYSTENGIAPMESLIKFPMRTSGSPRVDDQVNHNEDQLQIKQHQEGGANNVSNGGDQNIGQGAAIKIASPSNDVINVNNNSVSTASVPPPTSTVQPLQYSMNNAGSPFGCCSDVP